MSHSIAHAKAHTGFKMIAEAVPLRIREFHVAGGDPSKRVIEPENLWLHVDYARSYIFCTALRRENCIAGFNNFIVCWGILTHGYCSAHVNHLA